VLLIAFWMRSCYCFDVAWGPITKANVFALGSAKGLLVVAVSPRPSKGAISKSVWGFETYPHSVNKHFGLSSEVIVPDCILIVLVAAMGALPWIRWRFTLRTLLIATTLVAVVLGLSVYAMRTH
jgi:ABC-type glycerol-3-phosphate transport system permease component